MIDRFNIYGQRLEDTEPDSMAHFVRYSEYRAELTALRADYAKQSALVTSQGIRLMEADDLAAQLADVRREHAEVLDGLRATAAQLAEAQREREALRNARPYAEWYVDDGPVLWWTFPVNEPPYVGTPNDDDWPFYHTHWTPIIVPIDTALERT